MTSKLAVTIFPDQYAKSMRVKSMTLCELRDLIQTTSGRSKAVLPFVKLASFNGVHNENNCLRYNAAVEEISGIELDYDKGEMTLDAAIAIAKKAKLAVLFYTSASYSELKPRWRLLAPTSKLLPPGEHAKLVARVNGLYGGVFSPESFTLSQSYYYGSVKNNPAHRAVVTKGKCIDERGDLDATAVGKSNGKISPEAINFFEEYAAELLKPAKPLPLDKLEFMLSVIPNTVKKGRAHWVRVAHAVKYEQPNGDGQKLFSQWSRTWDGALDRKYETNPELYEKEIDKFWEGVKPDGSVTGGSLYFLADEADETWRARWDAKVASVAKDLEVFDAGDDTELPPPRAWLLGNSFARNFLSSLFADGGVGKTALRYAQMIALATGIPITGEHVFQRCRVLIVSLEDDRKELQRRIEAVLRHHKIARSEVKGWLFYTNPNADNGKLMTADKHGRLMRGALADKIERAITTCGIDIVSIDPFVKAHSIEENNNSGIDAVVQILTDLTAKHDISIDVPHHVSKGVGDPGNANRGRGASSMKDAARLIYTLTPMSDSEADRFEISEEERRSLIRVDSGKVNIAKPSTAATWFRLVGVPLLNSTELYPKGDEVQTVEVWLPPDTWADMDVKLLNRILTDSNSGLPDGNKYTDGPNADEREAWRVVVKHATHKSEAQAKTVIKKWVTDGVLKSDEYTNPKTRKKVKGLKLVAKMRPK
jgi:AAA domain/Primase C terminal 2 (PriCT-2)